MPKSHRLLPLFLVAGMAMAQQFTYNPLTRVLDRTAPGNVHISGSGTPSNPCPAQGQIFVSTSGIWYCPSAGGTWTQLTTSVPGSGTPAYVATVTGQTALTVSEASHGQGQFPVSSCFSGTGPYTAVQCASSFDGSGNVTFAWAPSFTGLVVIIGATGGFTNPMTTKGDIIGGGASGLPTRLAVGADTFVLTADSAQPLGIKWAAGGGSSGLTVGTTTIASGTDKRLLFDNAGVLGEIATGNNGVWSTNGTGVTANSATLPSGLTIPGYAPTVVHQYGGAFGTPGGLALSPGGIQYFNVPQACTINGWDILVDAGTATVKYWMITDGTAIPTAANVINSAGVGISTGTHVRSTTVTDFSLGTGTTIAANNIGAVTITATSGAGYISAVILCQ